MTDTEPDKLIAIVCFLSGGAAAPLHRRYSTFLPNLSPPPPPCLPTEMTLWGQNLFNIDGIHATATSKQEAGPSGPKSYKIAYHFVKHLKSD